MDRGAARREMLADIGRAAGHGGAPVVSAHLLGAVVDLVVIADEQEHARRTATDSAYLDDLDTLNVLANLPRWEPVPLQVLSARERRMVRRAPRGCLEITGETVTRLAGPPLSAILAVVHDSDWDRGLNTASQFAPVATRVLIMDDAPDELAIAAGEAAEYGIGLAIGTQVPVRVVVPPELWRENYFTPGGWLFREQAYRVFSGQFARSSPSPVTARD
jgi:hypothetical protein